MKSGKFITLEGLKGVGKTTNLSFVEQLLTKNNIVVVTTREPGGTPLAKKIRQLLLDKDDEVCSNQAELLLIFAARAQHIQHIIQVALAQGKWVLCDRFTDSTYAYQGGGRKMDTQFIAWLENTVQGKLRPDLTLLLDAPVSVGIKRANDRNNKRHQINMFEHTNLFKRTQKIDRFESEQQMFFARVKEAYLQRAKKYPQQIKVINANQSLQQVQTDIGHEIQIFIEKHNE